jgi:bifunctional ADP-heptose synthase (sugar kinase/adenylyltransferase)
VLRAGRLLREQLEADAVFITRGEHGIAVFCPDGRTHSVHTISEEGVVGDGTGCGDAASAAAALALAAGADWLEAAELANAAGGVVSRFVGVHNPRPAEIMEWLARSG